MRNWIVLGFCFFVGKTKGYPEFLSAGVFSNRQAEVEGNWMIWSTFLRQEKTKNNSKHISSSKTKWAQSSMLAHSSPWYFTVFLHHHWKVSSILSREARSSDFSIEVALRVNFYQQVRCRSKFHKSIEGVQIKKADLRVVLFFIVDYVLPKSCCGSSVYNTVPNCWLIKDIKLEKFLSKHCVKYINDSTICEMTKSRYKMLHVLKDQLSLPLNCRIPNVFHLCECSWWYFLPILGIITSAFTLGILAPVTWLIMSI